ncbi:MAG TPA: GNAT family N-acetyltransferase [Gemmatimonadaceae bacterium]|nr:GNAT family N-acetyltransferase [Gemmatimonadaceae bacterium]
MTDTPAACRRASGRDAAALAEFAARTFTDTYAAFNSEEDMRAYLAGAYGVAQQSLELADPGMITVLAESAEGIVGFAQVRRSEAPPSVTHDRPVEIYRFYVDRSAHGTGVAPRLMNAALDAARDLGGSHAWLGVWERNARAIAFYAKSGFRDVGTQTFQLGADRQTDRVVVRALDPESQG